VTGTTGEVREAFPMFPLGSVLVPGQALPLHVFEPRYRQLVQDITTAEAHRGEFGVVLIERGSEVGGGDVRFDIGTIARVIAGERSDDGRYALMAVGTARLRVLRWLVDDPYPRADVQLWPDQAAPGDLGAERQAAERRVRRWSAVRTELGLPAPPATTELHADPAIAAYHAALLCGRGPLDLLDLLGLPGPAERLARIDELLADDLAVLEGSIAAGRADEGPADEGPADEGPADEGPTDEET